MSRNLSFLLAFSLLAISACTGKNILPPLPEGPQTLTGTVIPTTISTARRGTHILRQGDAEVAYLESTTVNLREFQGRTTALRGHFEHNIDGEDLPVLVVESIVSSQDSMREWSSTPLSVSAQVPIRWGIAGTGTSMAFIPAGSLSALVSLQIISGKPLPSGITLSVGGSKAIRFLDELSGEQRLAVERRDGYLEIAFTPQREENLEQARVEWLAFLRSLRIGGTASTGSSSAAATSSTGVSQEGQPCGGLAGILCPAGSYCEITDLDQNIGVCRRME
ncbi:MAG: hypothetical protein Greene041662_848 [Candidatus Peregrinibacteria bacterium Greene0416_62]|nr:MAG: hypothetical protein Greene041662_848 [Candidatus Peregrinibacteria bacterium Greene0416_62]TSC99726.1 MAG: hypothetical protein Greene101449_552 [Candidatus Peregrinibacteria bacterium Greene1014_49]